MFKQIHNAWCLLKLYFQQKTIIAYLDNKHLNQEEFSILEWLKYNRIHIFPYDFTLKYFSSSIEVFFDETVHRKYVVVSAKRMYLKKNMIAQEIKWYVNSIMLEQDAMSPHRYPINKELFTDKIVADLGAAEGIFSLSIIDYVKKLYLFECDLNWIAALKVTFKDYLSDNEAESKVVIVNQFIGNTVSKTQTTLDEYFADKSLDYIKADIEGSEISMLQGGKKTFTGKVSAAVICSYHRASDEQDIKELLSEYGYECHTSMGYMLFPFDKEFKEPYLRRALLYGKNTRKTGGESIL